MAAWLREQGQQVDLRHRDLDEGESIERVVLPISELYDRLMKYSKQIRIIISQTKLQLSRVHLLS